MAMFTMEIWRSLWICSRIHKTGFAVQMFCASLLTRTSNASLLMSKQTSWSICISPWFQRETHVEIYSAMQLPEWLLGLFAVRPRFLYAHLHYKTRIASRNWNSISSLNTFSPRPRETTGSRYRLTKYMTIPTRAIFRLGQQPPWCSLTRRWRKAISPFHACTCFTWVWVSNLFTPSLSTALLIIPGDILPCWITRTRCETHPLNDTCQPCPGADWLGKAAFFKITWRLTCFHVDTQSRKSALCSTKWTSLYVR